MDVTLETKLPKKKIAELSAEEKKEYNKLHRRKSRKKEKIAEVEEERLLELERAGIQRNRDGLCFFGEISPNVPARTNNELIKVLRQFLRALGEPDVAVGQETTQQLGMRCWQAYLGGPYTIKPDHYCYDPHVVYVPSFNLKTQDFDPDQGHQLDPTTFNWVTTREEQKLITSGMLLPLAIKPVYRVEQKQPEQSIPFDKHQHRSVLDYNSTLDEPFMNSQTGQLRIPSSDLDPVAARFLMGQR